MVCPGGLFWDQCFFNLFINDLDRGFSSTISKFADNTKFFQVVKIRRDCEELPKDLSMLEKKAIKWQMHMHIGL